MRKQVDIDDILVGPTDVADLLKEVGRPLPARTVSHYASTGRIPVLKAGKQNKIFSKSDVIAWNNAGRPNQAKQ
jgi:hypothetical protein